MSQLANYVENVIANAILRNTALPAIATPYLALYTSDPGETDAGAEVSGGGYARVAITFAAPSGRESQNSAEVSFGTASANLGTITHWGVRSALTGGNLLWSGALTVAKTVNNGNPYKVEVGQIVCKLKGAFSTYVGNAILNHLLRNVAWTQPATVYTAFYTNDPTEADTGTEAAGGGYARQATAFAAPTDGLCQNSGLVSYGTMSAGLGTLTHCGIRDAATSGNLLLVGALTSALPVAAGDPLQIAAGALVAGAA